MDPRFYEYYSRELQHVRDMGGEFAREFPKIAGRLGLDAFECADPYVERLLEGFAFLAARVQLKIDAEFPRFTQHLLEMVYPHYVAPTPSMAVVHLRPDLSKGVLLEGVRVARDTALRSLVGAGDEVACEYRTAHDVTLWPLEVGKAEYLATPAILANAGVPKTQGAQAAIRLQLRAPQGVKLNKLPLDNLPLFLRGVGELPTRIYEQLVGNGLGIVLRPTDRPAPWQEVLPRSSIRQLGFDDAQALLPYGARSFQGYRLLQEYFALPERYLFVDLQGLGAAFRRCEASELEVIVLLDRSEPLLEEGLDGSNFELFCTPAINLFPKRLDRIHLTEKFSEYHAVPDRSHPMDFEVYRINEVTGYGGGETELRFRPFYSLADLAGHDPERAYFSAIREPRALSSRQKRDGPRSHYIGSEVFVSLVDAREAPFSRDLSQLGLSALCTNRDLPMHMPVGKGKTDFTVEAAVPVAEARCVAGPTEPKPAPVAGENSWRVISHLSLNYLSLLDDREGEGAQGLRELLLLYADPHDASLRRQIQGIRSIAARPVTRRLPMAGPIVFGRGLEISVNLDEAPFEGRGVFLMGAVLEGFFARYVSLNSFTETVIKTPNRGEVMRWPARLGRRQRL